MDDGDLRDRIQKAIVEGDNRLKQGARPELARESWERALELAKDAGIEEQVAPLVQIRIAGLEQLEEEPPPPARPAT
jgi:hypothetical protein